MSEVRRYRKKQIEVEAVQFLGDEEGFDALMAWLEALGLEGLDCDGSDGTPGMWLDGEELVIDLDREQRARRDDWIIRDAEGEFSICKPDIFQATYEPVEEACTTFDCNGVAVAGAEVTEEEGKWARYCDECAGVLERAGDRVKWDEPELSTEEEGFEHCKRCGRGNAIWSAPSPLWNAVMRGGSINGEPKYGDLVCASCFMQLAEEQGIASHFRVFAEEVNVELETTTPSGRVWDEEGQLWIDPATPEPKEGGANGNTQPSPESGSEPIERMAAVIDVCRRFEAGRRPDCEEGPLGSIACAQGEVQAYQYIRELLEQELLQPTQPLQGSEVEREEKYPREISWCHIHRIAKDERGCAQCLEETGGFSTHVYVPAESASEIAALQAQLQRVEERRDWWKAAAEKATDLADTGANLAVRRTVQRDAAETRIQEAVEEFESRAEYALTRRDASTYRAAAEFLRVASPSTPAHEEGGE